MAVPQRKQRASLAVGRDRLPVVVEGEAQPGLWVLAVLVPCKLAADRGLAGRLEFPTARGLCALDGVVQPDGCSDGRLLFWARTTRVEQRRELARIDVMLPVVLSWPVGTAGQRTYRTTTLDLSGGGALVAAPPGLKPDQEVGICLTLGDGGPDMLLRARVVRVVDRSRVALRFEAISESQRERIIRFVLRVQREQIRRRREVLSGGG